MCVCVCVCVCVCGGGVGGGGGGELSYLSVVAILDLGFIHPTIRGVYLRTERHTRTHTEGFV